MRKFLVNKFIFLNFLFFILSFGQVFAKDFNYPYLEIDNFTTKQFKGSNQTWGITQNTDGRIFFANQGGILIYDGKLWKTIFAKYDAPGRSIALSTNGKILVGTMGDFGKVISNIDGEVEYESFLNEEDKSIITSSQVVYETIPLSEKEILLRTKNALYIHSENGLNAINNPQNYKFGVAKYIDDKIYVYCINKGMCQVNNNSVELINGTQTFNNSGLGINYFEKISAEEMLLITRREGIFILNNGDLRKIDISNNLLNSTNIYRGIRLKNGNIALATYDGIFIIDRSIKPIIHINRTTGLLDDNIRSLFEDADGNLWAGLNNGISKIKLSSPINSYPQELAGINSKTRGLAFFENTTYIATDVGIKKLTSNKEILRDYFTAVIPSDLKTQVWGLTALDKQLFIASNFGLGKIVNGKYENEIDKKITGRVYKIKLSKFLPKTLFLAAEKGLFIYETKTNNLINIKLDKGKVWVLEEDHISGVLWTKIIGMGVYTVDLKNYNNANSIAKKYTNLDGLPDNIYRSLVFNYVNNQILLGTKYGTFMLNEETDKFIKFKENDNNKSIFNSYIKYSKQLGDHAWVGIEDKSENGRNVSFYSIDKDYKVRTLPLTDLRNEFNFEFYPLGDQVLISSSAGITIVDKNPIIKSPKGKILINEASFNNTSILNAATISIFKGGDLILPKTFAHDQNNLIFSIAGTDYSNEKEILFRHKLIGASDFSTWTKNNFVTYTNLSPGFYKLIIEANNYYGQTLKPFEYEFQITPPWWETSIFYISEICFFILLFLAIIYTKKSSRGSKVATSLIFLVILILFEIVNTKIDPLVDAVSGGVPVFAFASKIVLALLLEPLVGFSTTMIDKLTGEVKEAA